MIWRCIEFIYSACICDMTLAKKVERRRHTNHSPSVYCLYSLLTLAIWCSIHLPISLSPSLSASPAIFLLAPCIARWIRYHVAMATEQNGIIDEHYLKQIHAAKLFSLSFADKIMHILSNCSVFFPVLFQQWQQKYATCNEHIHKMGSGVIDIIHLSDLEWSNVTTAIDPNFDELATRIWNRIEKGKFE